MNPKAPIFGSAMTVRDHIAIEAMKALISLPADNLIKGERVTNKNALELISIRAFEYADALIALSNKETNEK